MSDTKTRDEKSLRNEKVTQQRLQERAAARARFGDRSVEDVLLHVRTRLRMLSDLSMAQVEGDGELSSDGWAGLANTLDDVRHDVGMLEDALPAEMNNWRPSKEDGEAS